MAQFEVIKYQSGQKKSNVPVTEVWNGVRFIRAHSVISTAKEILEHNKFFQATRVGIVGNMGTGKSTLAMTLTHLIHKLADVPFAIRLFDEEALLNFKETITNLEPANYILIIDDASFLSAKASKQKMDGIKQDITKIRHFPNQVDKRIIMIINWHYEYGLDKMIRSTDFRYCTSVGISDTENLSKLVGVKYLPMIQQFQQMCVNATKEPYEFKFMLGRQPFIYNYRKPHIPLLFYNKHTLRFIVSPTRQFVDAICNLCSNAENKEIQSDIEEKELMTRLIHTYGPTAKTAAKAVLFGHGINLFPLAVKRCMRAIDELFSRKIVNLEKLAEVCELEEKDTLFCRKINFDVPDEIVGKKRNTSMSLTIDLVEKIDKLVGYDSSRGIFVESILRNYLNQNEPIKQETAIVPVKQEYDDWDYNRYVEELEKMAKLPPEQLDRERYEFLNKKAVEVGQIKA